MGSFRRPHHRSLRLDLPRFFNLYPDDELLGLDKPGFELEAFTTIDTDESDLHAQVLTLIAA